MFPIIRGTMERRASEVIFWIEGNLPPLSWSLIKVHNIKVFLANGIRPTKIEGDTVFNQAVLDELKAFVQAKYSKVMPY
ncbi:hypothetical protein BFP72_11440 [Reichenbachiella sp. 5M10]|nr:hypothetical protein BFP72_11440 [Reichenbachiella sp. 5M10]